MHESLQTARVVKALQMALRNRRGRTPQIHHSDKGIQYYSALYQSVHEDLLEEGRLRQLPERAGGEI